MRKFLGFVLSVVVLTAIVGVPTIHCQEAKKEAKKVLVAGFINLGSKSDDSVNTVLTKSFITFLNMLPDSDMISYDETEKLATDNNYWEAKKFDKDNAIQLGQMISADQVITGEYFIENEQITIKIYVYETDTRERKFNVMCKGSAGMDVFDIVDEVIEDVTSLILSKKIVLAKLNVTIKDTDNTYYLTINGKTITEVNKNKAFRGNIFAGLSQTVGLKNKKTGVEVYTDMVNLDKGEEKSIDYIPLGTLIINVINLKKEAYVYIDGKKIQKIENKKTITIPNLLGGKSVKVEIISEDKKLLLKKNFLVKEGKSSDLEMDVKIRKVPKVPKTPKTPKVPKTPKARKTRRVFFQVSGIGSLTKVDSKFGMYFYPAKSLKLHLDAIGSYNYNSNFPIIGGELGMDFYPVRLLKVYLDAIGSYSFTTNESSLPICIGGEFAVGFYPIRLLELRVGVLYKHFFNNDGNKIDYLVPKLNVDYYIWKSIFTLGFGVGYSRTYFAIDSSDFEDLKQTDISLFIYSKFRKVFLDIGIVYSTQITEDYIDSYSTSWFSPSIELGVRF